jgi:hypothetical protein
MNTIALLLIFLLVNAYACMFCVPGFSYFQLRKHAAE